MRVLITNCRIDSFTGTELYVRDIGKELLRRGHTPIVFSTSLGPLAEHLRDASIPVVNDLSNLPAPDVIHGQHHLETATALMQFPGVPAISMCHGWIPWEEKPFPFPRILKHIAIDEVCAQRLTIEEGIEPSRVEILSNFVDLSRFQPRPEIPDRPKKALLFSNYISQSHQFDILKKACAIRGIQLEPLGAQFGNTIATPESVLPSYDLVFASGRSALEACSVGCSVIVCNLCGVGPLVTSAELSRIRRMNFGLRLLTEPFTVGHITSQIDRYDAEDVVKVRENLRDKASLTNAVDQLIAIYKQVIDQAALMQWDHVEESRAISRYLSSLAVQFSQVPTLKTEVQGLKINYDHLQSVREAELLEFDRLQKAIHSVSNNVEQEEKPSGTVPLYKRLIRRIAA